jgi:hypothetical protein
MGLLIINWLLLWCILSLRHCTTSQEVIVYFSRGYSSIMCCLVLSCRVLPCLVLSCVVLSCHLSLGACNKGGGNQVSSEVALHHRALSVFSCGCRFVLGHHTGVEIILLLLLLGLTMKAKTWEKCDKTITRQDKTTTRQPQDNHKTRQPQDKTRQDKTTTRQWKQKTWEKCDKAITRQDKTTTRQDNHRTRQPQDKKRQGKTRQLKTRQPQDKTRWYKARQDNHKTRKPQNKTNHRTRQPQDKTGQSVLAFHALFLYYILCLYQILRTHTSIVFLAPMNKIMKNNIRTVLMYLTLTINP